MGKRPGEVTTTNSVSGPKGHSLSRMKVTVCFGSVRVIVPCPHREMLVKDLIHQSILRYRKATGKSPDSWLVVHKLKTQSDGGILDPDDRLVDVADDREQIMAIYEEENDGMPSLQHIAGDGTSASSVGTNSPDIFQGTDHKFQTFGRTDIEITGEELNGYGPNGSPNGGGLTLQVRRGSEPALNRLSPIPYNSMMESSKRWSAAPIVDEDGRGESGEGNVDNSSIFSPPDEVSKTGSQISVTSSSRENSVICNLNYPHHKGLAGQNVPSPTSVMTVHSNSGKRSALSNHDQNYSGDQHGVNSVTPSQLVQANLVCSSVPTGSVPSNHISSSVQMRQQPSSLTVPSSRFNRDGNRLSMQYAMDGKWADAADRALFLSFRKEPVGAATSPTSPLESNTTPQFTSTPTYNQEIMDSQKKQSDGMYEVMELTLKYESGPLGIHLIPEHRGLIIQGVEPGGRIDRDGRLQAQDKIIEINGHSLLGVPFQQAQELFREGLTNPEIRLKVVKNLPKNQLTVLRSQPNHVQQLVSKFNGEIEEKENMIQGQEKIVGEAKIATVTPTRKSSPSPLQSLPLMRQSSSSLISANTRKIGRKYEIELQKGGTGLGFSITTRDNPAGGNCPIYIKNVLPTGAAIDDGRLRPGDRLLEVNGIQITGKSQSEAVSILRNVPQGGIVKLVVSRQERVDLSPKLPRQIPPEKASEDVPEVPWNEREILLFEIPVLDTEKAGLGISVKGHTKAGQLGQRIDNGIYIKSVIHGGAASRDGRLKPNDQLLSVNDVSLLDRSNTDAMETLRRTMTQNGPKPNPGFISLKIARRVPSSSAPTTDLSACGSSASGDEMDSWGSRNVSYSADGTGGHEQRIQTNSSVVDGKTQFAPLMQDNHPHSQNKVGQISQSLTNCHNRASSLRVKSGASTENSGANFNKIAHEIELPRNPVLERLTGKFPNAAVRNESYYRATNEPRNHPLLQCPPPPYHHHSGFQSESQTHSFVNRCGQRMLMENDYSPPSKPPRRSSTPEDVPGRERKPSLTNSSEVSIPQPCEVPPSDVAYASQTSLEDDAGGFARDAFGRQSMSEKRHATLDAKGTDTYQRNKKLREERERHRQYHVETMSHQLMDERNMRDDIMRRGLKRPFTVSNESELNQRQSVEQDYQPTLVQPERQKVKGPTFGEQLRDFLYHWTQKHHHQTRISETPGLPRVGSADSLVESLKQHQPSVSKPSPQRHERQVERRSKKDIGPSLGMKKSSSLESLQTMVQEIQIQEDVKSGHGPLRSGPAPVRVVRGRGCNESFRQAVDRSYEAPLGDYENEMETLAEEEAESCVSGGTLRNAQPSEGNVEEIYGKKGGSVKKKPGLFRGLGSMFRFGRHRKSVHGPLSAHELRKQQAEIERIEKEDLQQGELDKAREAAHAENMRIQEQYRRLVERQKQENAQASPYGITVSIANKGQSPYGTISHLPSNSLRPNHPFRKSMDSYRGHGSRSMDRDAYHRLRHPDINGNSNSPSHLRSASYDLYNEITRPGSRVGYVDPKKYSHYINYDEIRHHLKGDEETPPGNKSLSGNQLRQMKNTVVEQRKKAILESRRHQQHYHSQRRGNPKERQERPVSNFYEYESVQGSIQEQGISPPNYHHHHQRQQQPIYVVRNRGVGNNGVTLPSPTTIPFNTVPVLRQRSPSQFQAPPPPPFYATRQQQFLTNQQLQQQQHSNPNVQKQSSVSHQKGPAPPPPTSAKQQEQQQQSASRRHPQQQPQSGRYSMTHSVSSATSHTHTHVVKTSQAPQQCISPTYSPQPQILVGPPNYQYSQQQNAGHRTIPSGNTTSFGSKV